MDCKCTQNPCIIQSRLGQASLICIQHFDMPIKPAYHAVIQLIKLMIYLDALDAKTLKHLLRWNLLCLHQYSLWIQHEHIH